MSARQLIITLICGVLFGFGLALSTMTSPEVIISFLVGHDFGLLLVMGGALTVTLIAYQLVPRVMNKPLLNNVFSTHPSVLNRDTVIGSAIFGIGWGLCGVCPGPAIAGLGTGNWTIGYALIGMIIGAYTQGRFSNSSSDQ